MREEMVSGIITTYKRDASYVIRAVQSILNQTYYNIEVIVVDDSPQDYLGRNNVKESCLQLGQRVKYIQHEINKGACAARNTGLLYAKGDIIGFLDDDDVWLPNKVEVMLSLFDSDDVALVYCGSESVNTITGQKRVLNTKFEAGKIYEKLIYENFVGSTSFPLLRKSAVLEVGKFDENMKASQDYDLWLRIAAKYEVRYTKEILVRYYIHEGDQIGKTTSKRIAGYERIIQKNKDYLDHNPNAYWHRLRLLIYEYCDAGEYKKASRILVRCFTLRPNKIFDNAKLIMIILRAKALRQLQVL